MALPRPGPWCGEEHFRVGRQHNRGHGAPRGQTCDENAFAVETMRDDHRFYHLPDGKRLAAVAPDIPRHEPVEAKVGVVGALLLGEEQCETKLISELRPARVMVVGIRGLGAAMQNDD